MNWSNIDKSEKSMLRRDFPGGPVVKTLCFQCRGHGFDPCWGKNIPHAHATRLDQKHVEEKNRL